MSFLARAYLSPQVAPPNTYIRPGAADELLECIERDSDEKIRSVMTNMTLEDLKVSMITASSSIERRFRTPLMAAAARGIGGVLCPMR